MTPFLDDGDVRIFQGDALEVLAGLPDGSVNCCVTSPPYWGLRDYGVDGQLGLEASPEEYVSRLVAVFQEVRRVLADDGTLWLNLGDSYSHGGHGSRDPVRWPKQSRNDHRVEHAKAAGDTKPKNLVGIPWRVAFALQADGWYLRSDIIWSKPNPMPEPVTDRPTKSHEYLFLLSKSARYFYDAQAIAEPATWYGPNGSGPSRGPHGEQMAGRRGKQAAAAAAAAAAGNDASARRYDGFNDRWNASEPSLTRNARSVWTIQTQQYADAHFAVFPEELPRRCILAGCPEGGTVLDPFAGSGTTGLVARKQGRRAILIELNESYCQLAANRLAQLSLLA